MSSDEDESSDEDDKSDSESDDEDVKPKMPAKDAEKAEKDESDPADASDSDEDDKDVFWADLDRTLHAAERNGAGTTILCIDANARVGSVQSEAIGPAQPEPETDNGQRLRLLLDAHGLHACNTYAKAGSTWSGTRGHESRIDYVCAPTSARAAVGAHT